MSPVATENFLMFVEKSPAQSVNDPLTIFLPDPEDPEVFQPLLFPNRPLPCEKRDNCHLPSSLFRQLLKTCQDRGVLLLRHLPHVLEVGLSTVGGSLELQKHDLLRFLVNHPAVCPAESDRLFHLRFINPG